MAKVQHNRTTAASILQISFSHNITKCANKDGFQRDMQSHMSRHSCMYVPPPVLANDKETYDHIFWTASS